MKVRAKHYLKTVTLAAGHYKLNILDDKQKNYFALQRTEASREKSSNKFLHKRQLFQKNRHQLNRPGIFAALFHAEHRVFAVGQICYIRKAFGQVYSWQRKLKV